MTSLLLALVLFASPQNSSTHSASFDLPAGQEIRMDLSAGEYEIVGTADNKVRVSWWGDDRYEADHVKVRFRNDRGVGRLETDHTKDVHMVIQVPSRSDLHVRLSAGELKVSGVEGDKDISMTAGELRINVGDPEKYRDVHSSVRIGEITAKPFNLKKEGFFRAIDFYGKGGYSLRATVGFGEVVLTH